MEADVAIGVGRVRAVAVDHLQLFDGEHAAAAEDMGTEREAAEVGLVVAEDVVEEGVQRGVTEHLLGRLVCEHVHTANREKGEQVDDDEWHRYSRREGERDDYWYS